MKTLIYRRWQPDPYIQGDYMSRVKMAREGEGNVKEIVNLITKTGFVEIRLTNGNNYNVPAGEVLAYIWEQDA